MVNKRLISEIFMKLESYDRINIISDILRLSNSLELEFYSSIIESILQYHKLSFNSLRDELNGDNFLKGLIDLDCMESNVRSKLISTLSLLKASNINGATHIFDFLRNNHGKFKEEAHKNPHAFEEVMLIYQLANDHPAFSFDHCQEIYDYLTQIRSLSVSRKYFNSNYSPEFIDDLNLLSIDINDQHQYVYLIKVKWDTCECCITRTLEEIYRFYQKICEMFPWEIKSGEICGLFLSFFPDNLELSLNLMSKFFKDFLNSPKMVLRCEYVHQFFKPKMGDKNICSCESCPTAFDRFQWGGYRRFDSAARYNSPIDDQSDNERLTQFSLDKTDTPCSSNFNFSVNSRGFDDNISPDVFHMNRICADDVKRKSRMYSSGSSPINTPSDESEIFSKNESLKNQSNKYSRQLSMVNECNIESTPVQRTENWWGESNQTLNGIDSDNSSDMGQASVDNTIDYSEDFHNNPDNQPFDISSIAHCYVRNLYDWLRHIGLENYLPNIRQLTFKQFYSLTEDEVIDLGVDEEAAKTLVSVIRGIRQRDIVQIDRSAVSILLRQTSNSFDQRPSFGTFTGNYSMDFPIFHSLNRLNYQIIVPQNYFLQSEYCTNVAVPIKYSTSFTGTFSSNKKCD